jgi:hypothetical protein
MLDTATQLKLVVSNPDPERDPDPSHKIVACIRPLDRDVAPSEEFRTEMKLRLLKLDRIVVGPRIAA